MRKELVVVSAFVFLASVGFEWEKTCVGQLPAAEFKVPPEEAKRANPVKADASSIAEGKRLFGSQCAMCHGKVGDGRGELADTMELKLRDYRDPVALKNLTDGELFYIVSQGKGKMPDQSERLSANQRWKLINYIRSLAKKELPPRPTQEKPR